MVKRAPPELVAALKAVLGRLGHMYQHWQDALASYFDPPRFVVALQSCIITSRSITFILQSNKHAFPDFENWYSLHQARMASDPVMEWAKNARNKIEKRGDLETLSQVRVEVIAAYLANPISEWMPENVFSSVEHIRRSLPTKMLDDHVIENGTLAIERRWIDVELPDREVLDALAHVFGHFTRIIIDLHRHIRAPIPPTNRALGEHLLRDLLPDGRTPSMDPPYGYRAIYVSVKDGSLLGYRHETRKVSRDASKKARKRYGAIAKWEHLRSAKTLRDIAAAFFESAKALMLRDHHHLPFVMFLKGIEVIELVGAPVRDRASKYIMMRDLARIAHRMGADGVISISEAWTAAPQDIPAGRFAVDAAKRGEALMLSAANVDGEQVTFQAAVYRRKSNKSKVKSLGPTEIDSEGYVMALAPFLEIWGKVDWDKIAKLPDPP